MPIPAGLDPFPASPLGVRIRVAFGANPTADPATWTWTDVTPYWHVPDDVTIGWGRTPGAEQAETSTMSLTLKDTDGRFTSMDPRSPYWPNVIKWVPISYDIDLFDGVGWRNRFSGFVRKWPLTWPGGSSGQALAKIEAVGVLARLGRGNPAARSAMRRTITASSPLAYWPLEDGSDSQQAASGLIGGTPLSLTRGTVRFANADGPAGSDKLADFSSGGTMSGVVPPAATSTTWRVECAVKFAIFQPATFGAALQWLTGGTIALWEIDAAQQVDGGLSIQYITATGAFGGPFNSNVKVDDQLWHHIRVDATQSGSNIALTVKLDGTTVISQTITTATMGPVSQVIINPTGDVVEEVPSLGHLTVWAPFSSTADTLAAFRGYVGEAATDRLTRLCAEDKLPAQVPAISADGVTRMGRQPVSAPLDLYQQCEATDQGVLGESGFGLGYLPRSVRYNAAVALTIDAAQRQLALPFEPVDDDQALRNSWTVSRVDGSSADAVDQASIDSQGAVEASVDVITDTDAVLANHATWRLHLTTVKEPRYPAVSINLLTHPELAAAWSACKPGSRVQVVNPPRQNRPGVVDQLVVGASETFSGRRGWKATLNVVPASPWDVAVADGGQQRVAAEGSTLAADITATATSLQIASTAANGIWTTDLTMFPLDTNLGGERVTIGAPGQVLNANPWMVTDASGWVGSNATIIRSTAQQYDPAYGSLRVTPDGIGASGGANATARVAASAGTQYLASVWVYATTTILLEPAVDWYTATSGGTYITTGLGGAVSVPAGVWTPLSAVLTAPATTAGGLMRARHSGTPPTSAVWYVTAITLAPVTSYTSNPQTMTAAARAVNGVVKAHTAGEPVDVWSPAIAAL